MPEMSPKVEEFYNHHHDRHTGKFASGGSGANVNPYAVKRPQRFPARSDGGVTAQQARQTVMNDLNARSRVQSAKNLAEARRVYGTPAAAVKKPRTGKGTADRAAFREGSHSPAVAAARRSVGERGSGGRVATTNVAKKNWVAGRSLGKVWTYGPGRKTKSGGKGDVREENFVRGDGRKGPVHSQTKLHQGTVYTALKGSHSIRKTKSGGYVMHTKNAAPQKLAKHTADHIKMLDDHKPTAAEDVMGRIARWKAKG